MEQVDNDEKEQAEIIQDIYKGQERIWDEFFDIHIKHCNRMIKILAGKGRG